MALDYMAIASMGVYPTPTPTSKRRAELAVSFGLLNFTFPGPPISVAGAGAIILGKLRGIFLSKDIYL